ncbi:unnamed protein product [Lepeophtheirus salmonis]|uniref:(salmon louse) hypothetical protein n=1 Tax=Lepeophtheirus salmonis TaxID=72036 RepID=A0A7R8H5T6_LEPSM|nr:unnamed protein product [Lepeophtheirus salmonis]CAF2886710.1 unnamed protein product [Lepeophtheirus salmonis]
MLDLEVVPEYGLISDNVELILGMHFSNAIAIIQHMVGVIKSVEILYSEKNPLGFLIQLKYGDHLFNCPEVTPTIEQIDQSFGATHPGVYDDEKKFFTLTFRGLSFEFPAGTEFQPSSYGGIRRELGRLQFPVGESPRYPECLYIAEMIYPKRKRLNLPCLALKPWLLFQKECLSLKRCTLGIPSKMSYRL